MEAGIIIVPPSSIVPRPVLFWPKEIWSSKLSVRTGNVSDTTPFRSFIRIILFRRYLLLFLQPCTFHISLDRTGLEPVYRTVLESGCVFHFLS